MADENETVMLSRVKMMTADEGQTWDLSPRDRVALRYVLTTLARLTADLAAVTAERDMWRGECASISAELDLPPGMRPMEGELRRMLGHNRALLAERDEARGLLDAADTTRREWEVRAATSYRDGRAAGLREAAAKLAELRDEWEVMMGDGSVAHNCGKIAHGHVIALAPPAAEPRDEGEVSDE